MLASNEKHISYLARCKKKKKCLETWYIDSKILLFSVQTKTVRLLYPFSQILIVFFILSTIVGIFEFNEDNSSNFHQSLSLFNFESLIVSLLQTVLI